MSHFFIRAYQTLPTLVSRSTARPSEVGIVLGFAIHYDIAELVDPHINVAAKIKKSALAQIKRADH